MTGDDATSAPDATGRLRVAGIALAAVLLTLFFMVLDFPYDRLAARVAIEVERATGTRVALGPVSLGLVRWGPGLASEGVRILQPDGTRLDLERLGLRPALSLSWLRGAPAWAVEIASARGSATGVLTAGGTRAFTGTLEDVDLELLPQHGTGTPLQLQGRSDADVDLVIAEEGPAGSVTFEARDGVLTHPDLPLPIPFQKIDGEIDLGGDDWARIRRFELRSPLASGSARGTIGRAPRFAAAPLRLQLEFTVSGAVQGSLNAQGVEVGRGGEIRVDVTGTPMRPVVR